MADLLQEVRLNFGRNCNPLDVTGIFRLGACKPEEELHVLHSLRFCDFPES